MVNSMESLDRKATPRPRRGICRDGLHGASHGGEDDDEEFEEETEEEVRPEHRPEEANGSSPTTGDGVGILPDYLPSVPAGHSGGDGHVESGDDWIDEMNETASERYRGYAQSTQDEVSDPEEWADVHYGAATSRSRSRSNNGTPPARTMPAILAAQRRRRLLWNVQKRW